MLKANKDNSLEIMESSSIRLSNEGIIILFQFQTHGNSKVKSIIEEPMSMRLVKNTSKNN
jgi:hypothetical protein